MIVSNTCLLKGSSHFRELGQEYSTMRQNHVLCRFSVRRSRDGQKLG